MLFSRPQNRFESLACAAQLQEPPWEPEKPEAASFSYGPHAALTTARQGESQETKALDTQRVFKAPAGRPPTILLSQPEISDKSPSRKTRRTQQRDQSVAKLQRRAHSVDELGSLDNKPCYGEKLGTITNSSDVSREPYSEDADESELERESQRGDGGDPDDY